MMTDLRLGDCLDPATGLVTLADQSVDVTICDPPYEAEAHSKGRRITVGGFAEQRNGGRSIAVAPIPYPPITEDERTAVSFQIARLTRRWILVFCQSEAIHLWRAALTSGGARCIRVGAWTKPDAQPQYSGDRPGVGWEAVVIAHGPERCRWNGGGHVAVWRYQSRGDNHGDRSATKDVMGQKPLDLMRRLVEDFSDRSELILDPFAGAGTTLYAARELGRRSIGWERVPAHYEIAQRRLSAPAQVALNLTGATE